MRHLLGAWKRLSKKVQRAPLSLFLDFDGTLAPIVKHPNDAHLPADVRASLSSLARSPACQVAIVSGRALADIRRRVGLRQVTYVGNHGFEIHGPERLRKNVVPARSRTILRKVIGALKQQLQTIPGVVLEDKGATLSIHYRMVAPASRRIFNQAFLKIIQPYLVHGQVYLRKGKKVYELRPPVRWDKGQAVSWLLRTGPQRFRGRGALTVYSGDDDTDEDVFRALKHRALTVRVGRSRHSAAQYYLDNPAQVATLLARIVQTRKGHAHEI